MLFLALIFELFIIEACTEKEDKRKENKLRSNELIVKGSDSEYELVSTLLELFSGKENGIKFTISGGGSGKGIEALLKKEINIATSSREMNGEEFKKAAEKGIQPVPLIFALDAVAFITHPMNGVDSLSPEKLQKIYSGEIENWSELGGSDLPIVLVGRGQNSGTNGYLLNRLHIQNWSENIIEMEHGIDVYEEVKSTRGSIGYLSLGTIVSTIGKPVTDVWAINIYTDYSPAVSPYEISKVQNGEYYLSRPLYLYFDGLPEGMVEKFAEFILTEEIQNSLWEFGYLSITDYQKKINEKNKLK